MGERRCRTSWVFDRPLLSDGLFWGGPTLGVVHAFYATSSVPFTELSVGRQIIDLVWRVLMGVLAFGMIGGSVRHVVRGYRGTDGQAAGRRTGSTT